MAEQSKPIRAHIEYMTTAADRLSYEHAKEEFQKQNNAEIADNNPEALAPAENTADTPAVNTAGNPDEKPAVKPEKTSFCIEFQNQTESCSPCTTDQRDSRSVRVLQVPSYWQIKYLHGDESGHIQHE